MFKPTTPISISVNSKSTCISTFNLASAKNKDMQFDNNMVKSQTATDKDSEPTPIHSNLDDIFEQVDHSDLFQNKEGENS